MPLNQPSTEAFKDFDEESSNVINNLHLDAEEEPRRIGATSRANSVRFDESANQGHWSHTGRSSMDLGRAGLGGLTMGDRTSSYKSEGRASSVHSVRSITSGRANSLSLEQNFAFATDTNRSPIDTPGLAPGLLLMGPVPAIIRCWMNQNFRHDTLMYAAICSGSHKSFIGRQLVERLGLSERIVTDLTGSQTVMLPLYLAEAVPFTSTSRSRPGSPAPQLPKLTVTFQISPNMTSAFTPIPINSGESRGIVIILGSDVLRFHSADIMFSTNNLLLFDDDRTKVSIPLVRPENEACFNDLGTIQMGISRPFSTGRQDGSQTPILYGLGQSRRSSFDLMKTTSVLDPINKHESNDAEITEVPPTGTITTDNNIGDSCAVNTINADGGVNVSKTQQQPVTSVNWRKRTIEGGQEPPMDYASASKFREAPQRKEPNMKVLRTNRSTSRALLGSNGSPIRSSNDTSQLQTPGLSTTTEKDENLGTTSRQEAISQPFGSSKTKVVNDSFRPSNTNNAGGSAFSWLKQAAISK